jgi:VIT1/CCC1 family predicted Fe2+/Mn2+ transporter
MNNIYIQTLKLGFENPEGISLEEVAKKQGLDISKHTSFNLHYITWFYDNFYNSLVEGYVNRITHKIGTKYHLAITDFDDLIQFHQHHSYIKGDAVNKYIDYLELERTREYSKQATLFATGSILIAILAVLLPFFVSPDSITNTGRIVLVSVLFTIAAGIYNAIDIAKAKPDKNNKFWSFSIIITVLAVVLSFLLISLVNKLVLNPEWWLKGLVVLPVFVFWLGQVIRKCRRRKV